MQTLGATCTVCNVLHGWSRGQKNEQQNNVSSPKNNATAGYKGPVKIELLKEAGLLKRLYSISHRLRALFNSLQLSRDSYQETDEEESDTTRNVCGYVQGDFLRKVSNKLDGFPLHSFFFYKNLFYKNVEAEIK